MFITEDRNLYACGGNTRNKLGLNPSAPVFKLFSNGLQVDKALVPTRVTALGNIKVADVSVGLTHTAVLTETGKVITFGRNSDGQLGRGHTRHSPNPGYVKPLVAKVATMICSGPSFTIVGTVENTLYMWGTRYIMPSSRPNSYNKDQADAMPNNNKKQPHQDGQEDPAQVRQNLHGGSGSQPNVPSRMQNLIGSGNSGNANSRLENSLSSSMPEWLREELKEPRLEIPKSQPMVKVASADDLGKYYSEHLPGSPSPDVGMPKFPVEKQMSLKNPEPKPWDPQMLTDAPSPQHRRRFSAPGDIHKKIALANKALLQEKAEHNTVRAKGTFEIAPFFSMVEREILKQIRHLIGWNSGDGIFSPGGSVANMYGIVASRYKKFPNSKTQGLHGLPPMAVFASEDSHYSIAKSAHWVGIGTENVVPVRTDELGRMIPDDLEWKINQSKGAGKVPICVIATCGSTVLGAFDPLPEIGALCRKHDLWLHVDACMGGAVIFSGKFRHLLNGVEEADSFIWNPHKMLGAPLQCSAFLIKEPGFLLECNKASAAYLFQQDKFYDVSYDSGDKSVQCGRKTDSFKLWAMWKARGTSGFRNLVENAFHCANYFYDQLKDKDGFKLVLRAKQSAHVCFWYIPVRLRGQEETEEWWNEVSKVAPEIKKRMTLKGSMMIGYQPLASKFDSLKKADQ
ncbi:unnamed protein product [Notodromas monacha]|uniref:Uncharacterized protein n=1 Tax=Notodromas monacha TaxID=399045 RepID=A0A7R9GHR9_9CRUS|nr:unnamed protein product [Notodromas monacha]CAG0921796.1 unnamed protein product [Notodromas monacha]